jgi:D-sedoheptulose 7-phosphate isomerase
MGTTVSISASSLTHYYSYLRDLLVSASVTDLQGAALDYAEAVSAVIARARAAHAAGGKLIFIGNGGSAAIASHMATDYSKNGGLRSQAMNDGSMLTCLGNDLGYENVFAKQIELFAKPGDLLMAISSSGKSPNILKAVAQGRASGCQVVTLSGFGGDNPLRKLGDINFYLESDQYGYVELGHLAICHAILDFHCGLTPPQS